MLFTGFNLRTPKGYLSEREQEALIKYVLKHIATRPATVAEIKQVLEGRLDAGNLSASTLEALRDLGRSFFEAGKPMVSNSPAAFAYRPRVRA